MGCACAKRERTQDGYGHAEREKMMMIEAIWMPLTAAVIVLVTTLLMAVGPALTVATGQHR